MPPEPLGPAVLQCDRHGPFAAIWTPAPVKDGVRAWEPTGECLGCRADAKAQRLIKSAGILPRYAGCSFDNFIANTPEQTLALTLCRAYAETFAEAREAGQCMVFLGNPGTGKNHLAVAITKVIAAQGYTALHTTARQLVTDIRSTWQNNDHVAERDLIQAFVDVDLLIIDEVGRSFGSEGERVHLFEVIDRRYGEVKPTIVMSNQTQEAVEEVLGEATFDRLREGNGFPVIFGWKSVRGASRRR